MLKKLSAKLALPKLERHLSHLRFLWAWGLRPIWMATFHALLFVLGLVSLAPGIVLQLASMIVSLVAHLLILGPLIRFVATPLAKLISKVNIFSSTALFTKHFKVHVVWGGTMEDRQWLWPAMTLRSQASRRPLQPLRKSWASQMRMRPHCSVVGCTISPQLAVCSRCSPCPCSLFFFLAASREVGLAIVAPFATLFSCFTWVLWPSFSPLVPLALPFWLENCPKLENHSIHQFPLCAVAPPFLSWR